MYKKLSIVLFILHLTGIAQAQDSARYKLSGIYKQGYDFYSRRALTQPLRPREQYAVAEASYTKEDGGFSSRQEAAEQNALSFVTEGTRKIKNCLVSGSFMYSRVLKDSMGYTQRSSVGAAPYYFYAGAKGNWEISHYNLQGIVSRPFIGEKLTGSAGASYQVGNAWRSNDPRTEEFTHDISMEAALHFAINAHHTLGAGGGYRIVSEENNNEYRNKDYQDNLLNMAYINVLQYGYGLSVIQTTNRKIDCHSQGERVNAVYRGAFGFGTVAATGAYSQLHSEFFRDAGDANSSKYVYGQFDEDIWEYDLIWESRKKGAQSWSIAAGYKDHLGKDFNTILNGNNYVYKEERLRFQPLMAHWKKERLQYELGLNGFLSRIYRADGTTDHLADYKNVDAGISGAYYFSGRRAANFLKLSAGVNWRKNIEATVSVPLSQETLFTKEVVYYDYYYNGADCMSLSGGALYNFQVKKVPFFIRATVERQKAKLPAYSLPAASLPGTERWFSAIALGFTL